MNGLKIRGLKHSYITCLTPVLEGIGREEGARSVQSHNVVVSLNIIVL